MNTPAWHRQCAISPRYHWAAWQCRRRCGTLPAGPYFLMYFAWGGRGAGASRSRVSLLPWSLPWSLLVSGVNAATAAALTALRRDLL